MTTFIDFSKAFDFISRTRLEEVLHNCRLPEVMSMYSGTTAQVVPSNGFSVDLEVEAGVVDTFTSAIPICHCCGRLFWSQPPNTEDERWGNCRGI